MAPKTQYDTDILQSRANELAQGVIEAFEDEGINLPEDAEISCEYLGVTSDEGFEAGSKVRATSVLGFQWRYRDGNVRCYVRPL